jgi:hypothetical protein
MNGTIRFFDAESLAAFLRAFVGCTATFKVEQHPSQEGFILTFTGGH